MEQAFIRYVECSTIIVSLFINRRYLFPFPIPSRRHGRHCKHATSARESPLNTLLLIDVENGSVTVRTVGHTETVLSLPSTPFLNGYCTFCLGGAPLPSITLIHQ